MSNIRAGIVGKHPTRGINESDSVGYKRKLNTPRAGQRERGRRLTKLNINQIKMAQSIKWQ